MANRLRGPARAALLRLNAELHAADDQLKAHRKLCYDCRAAQKDPLRFCDIGWPMAKRLSRARYKVWRFRETLTEGQQTLFDPPEVNDNAATQGN